MSPWAEILVLMSAGIFGGILSGMRECSEHKLRLPRTGRKIELGIVGDALIGAAASIATFTVAFSSGLILPTVAGRDDPHLWLLKLSSVGIVSGFAGIHLLSSISNRLVREVQGVKERVDLLDRREQSLEKSNRGEALLLDGRYEEAEREFSEALKLDPDNESAVIGLAKAFRWRGKVEIAIGILTDLIRKDPDASRAIYNRACYKLLLSHRSEAFSDLETAIKLNPYYRQYALYTDKDFKRVHDDPQFVSIVQPAAELSSAQAEATRTLGKDE